MTGEFIKNAVIEKVTLDFADRGLLTAWLHLNYGGTCQGFGGFSLYLPKSWKHHNINSPAGHFIFRCMEIAGVEDWSKMQGRTIRVKSDSEGLGSSIIAIGHIVKNDWFNPEEDFKNI
jgi:hypothetical protein